MTRVLPPIPRLSPVLEGGVISRHYDEWLTELANRVAQPMTFVETMDPDPPAVDTALLYARDNGAGKTQLCVRFHTGAVQVLATEP